MYLSNVVNKWVAFNNVNIVEVSHPTKNLKVTEDTFGLTHMSQSNIRSAIWKNYCNANVEVITYF